MGSQYQVIKYALSTMRRKLTIVSHGARMFVMARAYSRIRLARAITLAVLLYGLVDDSHALYKLITHAVKCLSIKCFKYTYYLSCFNVCNEINYRWHLMNDRFLVKFWYSNSMRFNY